MAAKMISRGLKALSHVLAAVGLAVLVLAAVIAWPVKLPPELVSIYGRPQIDRFQ